MVSGSLKRSVLDGIGGIYNVACSEVSSGSNENTSF